MFFGAVVKPGRNYPLVPHAEGFALHLSQASLAADVKSGTRASVLVTLGEKDEALVLCTLCAGTQDTVLLDQFMTEYAELSIQGSVPVHITGYYSPEYGPDGEDGEEDEDEEYGLPGHPLDLLGYGKHPMGDSESEEGESGDEDEDDSMDESEEDESSDDDAMAQRRKEPSVIIEDITDKEAGMANGAAAKDNKKRKAAAALPAAEAGTASAKKQAVTPQQQQKQQQQAKTAAQEQPKQQKQQQQQTPANKQQQKQQQQTPADKQQQKTPADKQQQKQQKQGQQTPVSTPAAAAAGTPSAQSVPSGKKNVRMFENGFEIHNVKMGDPHGKLAKGGKTVKVRYVGRLKSNGRVFDKTDKKPFAFRLGVGEVIKGWDRGVEGMRVGDKRKLVIPPQMGYGQQKTGPIPANSWLEFDVELLDVK